MDTRESGRDPSIGRDKGNYCYREAPRERFGIEDKAFVDDAPAFLHEKESIRGEDEAGFRWEEGRRR